MIYHIFYLKEDFFFKYIFIALLLRSARKLSESWIISRSEDDVNVSKRHDLRDLLPVIVGRWTRLRCPCDTALGRGTTMENAESTRECWQSSFRSITG